MRPRGGTASRAPAPGNVRGRDGPVLHSQGVTWDELTRQLTWVDWAVLATVLVFTVGGVGRGFFAGALDLLSIVASLGVAVLGYQQGAGLLLERVPIPSAVANLAAFLGLLLLGQVAYSVVANLLLGLARPLLWPLAPLDRALGAIAGAIKGIAAAALVLLPFALFPLMPDVSAAIERSTLASRLAAAAVGAAPEVEARLGRELTGGLSFLTPPQTDDGMRIDVGPVGQVAPDPAAEEQMLTLVNRERQQAGLRPLQPDQPLRLVARSHSAEMFELHYFAHNSPVSGSPLDRLRRAGIDFVVAGENLAYAPNVQIAHEGLMNSPGHRANILRPEFGRVGIGAIRSQLRGIMFSQEFTN
jgi:uncharacterized protein YkwD